MTIAKANEQEWKKRRSRLFKRSKPSIRLAKTDDLGWIWVGHKMSGGERPQNEVTQEAVERLSAYSVVWIIEDENAGFSANHGPVGIVGARFDGWLLEPHVTWFPWATNRNKLRGTVGFLMKMRQATKVGDCAVPSGCIQVSTSDEAKAWFSKLGKYLPIRYVGDIKRGMPGGNRHIFYTTGKLRGA